MYHITHMCLYMCFHVVHKAEALPASHDRRTSSTSESQAHIEEIHENVFLLHRNKPVALFDLTNELLVYLSEAECYTRKNKFEPQKNEIKYEEKLNYFQSILQKKEVLYTDKYHNVKLPELYSKYCDGKILSTVKTQPLQLPNKLNYLIEYKANLSKITNIQHRNKRSIDSPSTVYFHQRKNINDYQNTDYGPQPVEIRDNVPYFRDNLYRPKNPRIGFQHYQEFDQYPPEQAGFSNQNTSRKESDTFINKEHQSNYDIHKTENLIPDGLTNGYISNIPLPSNYNSEDFKQFMIDDTLDKERVKEKEQTDSKGNPSFASTDNIHERQIMHSNSDQLMTNNQELFNNLQDFKPIEENVNFPVPDSRSDYSMEYETNQSELYHGVQFDNYNTPTPKSRESVPLNPVQINTNDFTPATEQIDFPQNFNQVIEAPNIVRKYFPENRHLEYVKDFIVKNSLLGAPLLAVAASSASSDGEGNMKAKAMGHATNGGFFAASASGADYNGDSTNARVKGGGKLGAMGEASVTNTDSKLNEKGLAQVDVDHNQFGESSSSALVQNVGTVNAMAGVSNTNEGKHLNTNLNTVSISSESKIFRNSNTNSNKESNFYIDRDIENNNFFNMEPKILPNFLESSNSSIVINKNENDNLNTNLFVNKNKNDQVHLATYDIPEQYSSNVNANIMETGQKLTISQPTIDTGGLSVGAGVAPRESEIANVFTGHLKEGGIHKEDKGISGVVTYSQGARGLPPGPGELYDSISYAALEDFSKINADFGQNVSDFNALSHKLPSITSKKEDFSLQSTKGNTQIIQNGDASQPPTLLNINDYNQSKPASIQEQTEQKTNAVFSIPLDVTNKASKDLEHQLYQRMGSPLQPGDVIPGTNGYRIPSGFRGHVILGHKYPVNYQSKKTVNGFNTKVKVQPRIPVSKNPVFASVGGTQAYSRLTSESQPGLHITLSGGENEGQSQKQQLIPSNLIQQSGMTATQNNNPLMRHYQPMRSRTFYNRYGQISSPIISSTNWSSSWSSRSGSNSRSSSSASSMSQSRNLLNGQNKNLREANVLNPNCGYYKTNCEVIQNSYQTTTVCKPIFIDALCCC